MSYKVSYTHSKGDTSLNCYDWEVAGILRNLTHMALQGFEFSHVTIKAI